MKRNESLRNLCALCVSAVKIGRAHSTTAETQSTQRLRRGFQRRGDHSNTHSPRISTDSIQRCLMIILTVCLAHLSCREVHYESNKVGICNRILASYGSERSNTKS